VLELNPSAELTAKQIKGVEELVAKSVSGLQPANVVIIDGDGTILNGSDDDTGMGGTTTRLELVNSINSLYEDKINSLLEPALGKNGLSVSVNVVVDFTQKSSEETTYSPVVGESGIISHEDYDNTSTNGGTVAGGVAGTESNTGSTSYEQDGTAPGADSSASASGSADYLVNRMIETISDNGGTIKDMTVAVMINKSELSQEALEQYRELIAFGTGISTDKVAISYAEFLKNENNNGSENNGSADESIADLLGITEPVLYAAAGGAALLFIIVISVIIGASHKRKRKKRELEHKKADREKEVIQKADIPGEIVLNETREQVLKKQIKEFSSGNPEIVAQLLRSWMKEDNSK
jgi:flagellar M-ring protein FliF